MLLERLVRAIGTQQMKEAVRAGIEYADVIRYAVDLTPRDSRDMNSQIRSAIEDCKIAAKLLDIGISSYSWLERGLYYLGRENRTCRHLRQSSPSLFVKYVADFGN